MVNRWWPNILRCHGTISRKRVPQLLVAQRRQVGAIVAQCLGVVAVVGQLGEIAEAVLAEDPGEGGADLLSQIRANIAVHLLVRRYARLRAEELLVHGLPAEAGRTFAEEPDQRRIEVAVPTLHTELAEVVGRKLVGIERAHPHPCIAPAELGFVERGGAGERRDRVGEDLAHVGSGVDGKTRGQRRVRDVVLVAHGVPPDNRMVGRMIATRRHQR
ncbi:MAG: hypothetical protein IPL07_14040 [Acidimicrobiaceae bacterium]|nr:hypothetical protein [Acidimicrobiaceae bacterium]